MNIDSFTKQTASTIGSLADNSFPILFVALLATIILFACTRHRAAFREFRCTLKDQIGRFWQFARCILFGVGTGFVAYCVLNIFRLGSWSALIGLLETRPDVDAYLQLTRCLAPLCGVIAFAFARSRQCGADNHEPRPRGKVFTTIQDAKKRLERIIHR